LLECVVHFDVRNLAHALPVHMGVMPLRHPGRVANPEFASHRCFHCQPPSHAAGAGTRKAHPPMRTLSLDEFSACAAKLTAGALTKIKTMPNIGGAAAGLARSHAP
jgi:hypothetical protein